MKYKSAGVDITAACAPPKSPIQTDRCKQSVSRCTRYNFVLPAQIETNVLAAFCHLLYWSVHGT